MQVTLNDWTLETLGEIGQHPTLSNTAKGLALTINCGGQAPAYDPNGRTQIDKGYRALIQLGFARIK
jgi:hypothetical protein